MLTPSSVLTRYDREDVEVAFRETILDKASPVLQDIANKSASLVEHVVTQSSALCEEAASRASPFLRLESDTH